MTDPDRSPQLGDVWQYPYLWSREDRRGETEGRKPRPSVVALLLKTGSGGTRVLFLPITSQPPGGNRYAVEIPEMEKRRAGLDADISLWIIADEYNEDVCGESYYIEPNGKIGSFSKSFVKQVQGVMIQAIQAQRSRKVSRS